MAESKPDPISSDSSGKNGNDHHHKKETHGLREDIDETTLMSDVKAPNVFERAKEEIEALVEALHPKKESKTGDSASCAETRDHGDTKDHLQTEKSESHSDKNVTKPNFIAKAKEEIESLMHKPKHHKETHGKSDDINENTPISEVKGPNVFERAKEEIEALIQTIHPKKESVDVVSSKKKEGGFPASIGRGLEKLCSPRSNNKD